MAVDFSKVGEIASSGAHRESATLSASLLGGESQLLLRLNVGVAGLYGSFATLYALCGLPILAVVAFASALASLVIALIAHLKQMPSLLLHGQACIMLVLFTFEAIGSAPWDPAMIAFFGLVPLCMGMFVSKQGARFWAVVSVIAASATIVLGKSGASLGDTSPHLALIHLIRLAIWTPSCAGMCLLVARLRERDFERAVQAEAARGRFLATMSHEIRTPMNGVMGMAQLLLQSPLSTEQRDQVMILKSSSETMISLLNDLLDYSKIDAGKMTLEHIPLAPHQLANEVVQLFQPLALEKNVSLNTTSDSSVPLMLRSDPTRLKQIMSNLVGNAVKFTQVGAVTVHLSARGERFLITVEDTGIGIPLEAQQRLFQPFVQMESSTTRRFGGTGLGLAITARLVALMKGTIGVKSMPAQGSTFTVELPLEAAETVRPEPQAEVRPPPTHQRVLVVDDNAINLAVAEGMVKKLGYSTVRATTGVDAVRLCSQERFDIILMDLHMPELDGADATKAIRHGLNRETPVLALTASVMREDIERALAVGMNEVLTKPLRREVLIDALHRAVQPHLRRTG